MLQLENDNKEDGNWLGIFLAAKFKFCPCNNKLGVIEEHKIFEGFADAHKCLDRKEYFNMLDGKDFISKQPSSWKKDLEMGVIVPNKERNCCDFKENLICVKNDKLIHQTKIFTANLNDLKRLHPNQKGYMLHWYKDNFDY